MKVRDHLYTCFRDLVSGTETTQRIARILFIINFFQIIKNQFWQLGLSIQNNGVLLQYVIDLTQFFSVLRLMQKSNLEFFYEALVFAVWLLINSMFIILIVSRYNKSRKQSNDDDLHFFSYRKILVFWNIIFPFIALDICLEVLLSTFTCTNSSLIGGFLDKSSTDSSYCSSVLRYVLMTFSIEAILLLVIFSLLNSALFIDDSFNFSNSLARSRNVPAIIFPVFKIIICVLAVCSIYSYSVIITSAIFLGICIVYSWLLHAYHTYYDLPLAELDMMLFVYQIAISAASLAQGVTIQVTNGKIIPSFALFCLFLLAFKLARTLTKMSFAYHSERKFTVSSNPVGLDKKIKILYTAFKYHRELLKTDKNSEVPEHYLQCQGFLIRAVEDHRFTVIGSASDPTLVFDPMTKQTIDTVSASNSQKVMSPTYVKYLIKTLYQQAIAFHPRHASLRMGLAGFLLFELQHIYLTILECIQIKRLVNLSWARQYQLSCFHQEISQLFKNMNKKHEDNEEWSQFDLERLLAIDTNFQKLRHSLMQFFQFSKEFCDYILSERPSLAVLEQKSVNQLSNYASIEQSFETLKNNPKSIRLYSQFLREVMGDSKAAKALELRLRQLLDKAAQNRLANNMSIDPNLAYSEDATLITIGGTRENLGRIISANIGAEKLFGHKKEELFMSNIKRLMPGVIGDKHDTFLNNFLETSRMTILYKERVLYGRHKQGHVFSLNLLVKPIFDTTTNLLQFISFIQPLSQDVDHIITDSTGLICGISRNIAKTLKIDPLVLENTKVYLPTLAPKSLYLYLDDLEQQKIMKRKNSHKKQLSFKRLETDIKRINRNQDGEFLFHMYMSKNLLDTSARIYDPSNPPGDHEVFKENFQGSEVFKLRCTVNEFECSDASTRLKFFCVSEIEFIYKKKTKAAIETSVSSYKTWDKMFFSQIKNASPSDTGNPLSKVAGAFKKNFHVNVEPESPGLSPSNARARAKRKTRLRNLLVKAVKAGSQATVDKETNEPESMENVETRFQETEEPRIKFADIVEPTDKEEQKEQPKRKLSSDNIKKAASNKNTSYQKALTHGNTLTVEPQYRKSTTNELMMPFTRFKHTLSPILSEKEFTTQQNFDEESMKERLINKSSLKQMDSYGAASLGRQGSSALGTKELSVAQLAHWANNTNRPNILDNPPPNSDSYISEEDIEDAISKSKENSKLNEDVNDSNTTPIGVFSSSETEKKTTTLSMVSRKSDRKLSKYEHNNNTDSFEGFVPKSKDNSENSSKSYQKSMTIGTALKFYTDTSKKFKRLLQKSKERTGRIKGVNFGDVAKNMIQEKIRNFIEKNEGVEGSISSNSSKQSNTTKKFILSSIQHDYIPAAYYTFRAILYLCFVFLIASTMGLALQQSQTFTALEDNYDNGRNYVNYLAQIAALGSSVYDLLYLQANLYASNTAEEKSYLYDLSVNKTLNSIGLLLENYSVVRTGNDHYFDYTADSNVTQLNGSTLGEPQALDLTQSINQLCTTALSLIRDLQGSSTLTAALETYDYVLRYITIVVNHMSSKISLDEAYSVQKSSKTVAILVLVFCTLLIAVLWLIAVKCVFKCFFEIQKVLILMINLPSSDLIELRNIMDQALHTLQNNEFKYRPPPLYQGSKSSIKRFIPMPFHRFKIISAGIILLVIALLSYILTIANAHSFDNSLLDLLSTSNQIDMRMYEKYYWEQSLKDIIFYRTQGYSFSATSNNSENITELYQRISDYSVQEIAILSQIDTLMADSIEAQSEIKQLLQKSLCSNPSITINRTSVYPCLVIFDNSLAGGI